MKPEESAIREVSKEWWRAPRGRSARRCSANHLDYLVIFDVLPPTKYDLLRRTEKVWMAGNWTLQGEMRFQLEGCRSLLGDEVGALLSGPSSTWRNTARRKDFRDTVRVTFLLAQA